nr:hypothetical protein [uncultured Carboxylicivirga sp.]
MIKYTLLLISLISALTSFAQTADLEKAALQNKFASKELSQEMFSSFLTRWDNLLAEVNGYPDLPLDQDSLVHYTYVTDFPGVDKDHLFNQTMEYLAVKHGLYPSFMYSNKEDGRIIFDNSFELMTDYTGFYTGIITIIDEKVVFEFVNLSYQAFFPGHYKGNVWVEDKTVHSGIDKSYPIILKDPAHWKLYLALFDKTNYQVISTIASFRHFQNDYPLNRKL